MKHVLLSLLSVSLVFASVYEGTTEDLGIEIELGPFPVSSKLLDNPDGVHYVATPEPLDLETLTNINDPSSAFEYTSPIERAISYEDEGSSVWPDYDWADDVEVYPGRVGSGQEFDIDRDTYDIYATFDTDHTTGDSLIVYRSQDGGETWNFFACGVNNDNSISSPNIRVVKNLYGETWIVAMGIWHETTGDVLWTRRWTTSGGSATWEQVATGVRYADIDADVCPGNAWAYITYVPEGTSNIYATGNALLGDGWVNNILVFTNTVVESYPAIAKGSPYALGIAFIDGRLSATPQVRITRSTDKGVTWLASEQVSNATVSGLEHTDLTFSDFVTSVGWITVTFNSTTDNFGYYYSEDDGVNWTYGDLFPGSGGDENLGSIRVSYPCGILALSYNVDPGDSVMYAQSSHQNPTDFSTPFRINDFQATGYWPSCAAVYDYMHPAVLYTSWTMDYKLMFDWYENTLGINETSTGLNLIRNAPNPFSTTTNISFSLTQSSPVTISIYNVVGQLVTALADNQSFNEGSNSMQWDGLNESGTRVSPGVYFCRLSANGISETHRMLMVR